MIRNQKITWWVLGFAFLGYGVFICWNFVQGGTSLLESMGVTSFLLGPLAFVLGMVVRFLMGRVKLKRTERIGGFLVALFCSLLQGFFAWMSCFFCATVIEMEPDSLKDTLTFYGCFLSAVIMLAHAVVTVSCVFITWFRGFFKQDDSEDDAKLVKRFRLLAERGDLGAKYKLGIHYWNGWGVPKDGVKAVKWLRKSAEQGNAAAQRNISSCYKHGIGVPKDEDEALKWLDKARLQAFLDEAWECFATSRKK